ncbi:MAG TPA: adenylate/guanylate cyclase domain-containing protein [Roseiarcus sp.]|jgi:TolB-like protein
MAETRKIAAILVADVVGYSRLAGADEEGTLARLRGLRSHLIDPAIAAHLGRVVNRTGDGFIAEFRSVVDAVRCAIGLQNGIIEHNSGLRSERRIELRMGVHLGDVIEESDGDLMGDGVNIAARLEAFAEPGGVCLSEDAWRQVRDKLKEAFVDLGEKALKNIARPMRVYALSPGFAAASSVSPFEKREPPRLSLVMLPFANIGGDAEQEHFVDGVTESLTTDLSRIRAALVIGRNTAFTYKGKAVDLKQTGRELNVRYVLEGSVQRAGNRMRVNVQLIDAETGNHLWAERFDKPLADLFDMQDEIVARLANALGAQLVAAEARRAEQAPNPNSMDLYFQGMAWLNKGMTPDSVAQARRFFDRALVADSDNVDALIGSARVDELEGGYFFVTNPVTAFAAAEVKLTKAVSSVPDHARAHLYLGLVHICTKRAAEGVAECEHALALDRNLAYAHSTIGLGKIVLGRAEETEAHIADALRLSPRDTMAYIWMTYVGAAKNHLGSWEQAVSWCRRAIEATRSYSFAYLMLAAALAQLGRSHEARSTVKAAIALNPSSSISRARVNWTAVSDNPTFLAGLEPILDGLLKAGVPEK